MIDSPKGLREFYADDATINRNYSNNGKDNQSILGKKIGTDEDSLLVSVIIDTPNYELKVKNYSILPFNGGGQITVNGVINTNESVFYFVQTFTLLEREGKLSVVADNLSIDKPEQLLKINNEDLYELKKN